jgi:hypothetical protein
MFGNYGSMHSNISLAIDSIPNASKSHVSNDDAQINSE